MMHTLDYYYQYFYNEKKKKDFQFHEVWKALFQTVT